MRSSPLFYPREVPVWLACWHFRLARGHWPSTLTPPIIDNPLDLAQTVDVFGTTVTLDLALPTLRHPPALYELV